MERNQSLFDLEVEHATEEELLETARWQRMLGILIVISAFLVLLILLAGWERIAALVDETFAPAGSQAAMIFAAVVLLLVATVAVIMAVLLVRGAARIKTAIRTKEQEVFNSGLADLKTFFIIYGVISIIGLLGNLVALF